MKEITVVFKGGEAGLHIHAEPVLDFDDGALYLYGDTVESRVTINWSDVSYFTESPLEEDPDE